MSLRLVNGRIVPTSIDFLALHALAAVSRAQVLYATYKGVRLHFHDFGSPASNPENVIREYTTYAHRNTLNLHPCVYGKECPHGMADPMFAADRAILKSPSKKRTFRYGPQ